MMLTEKNNSKQDIFNKEKMFLFILAITLKVSPGEIFWIQHKKHKFWRKTKNVIWLHIEFNFVPKTLMHYCLNQYTKFRI